jgi:6-phosphogluconolactonase/glucosamine-6-phosphate isomerase/deaminase
VKNGAQKNTPIKCYHCGKEGHIAPNFPEKLRNQKPQGQVNHVDAETAQGAPEIMMGTFNINSVPATVLFDSGASHTFISQAFVRNHCMPLLAMKNPMVVNSPGGQIPASYYCPSAILSLRG